MDPCYIARNLPEPIIIEFSSWTFTFQKIVKSGYVDLVLPGKDGIGLYLIINKDSVKVEISILGFYPSCFNPKYEGSRGGGTILLRLAIHIAKNILKAQSLSLFDGSTIMSSTVKLNLMTLSMLTTGDSWYGRYGFIPEKKALYKEHTEKIKKSVFNDLHDKTQEFIVFQLEIVEDSTPITNIMKEVFNLNVYTYLKISSMILRDLDITIPDCRYGEWTCAFPY